MKTLLKAVVWLLGINAAAWLVGRYLGKQLSSGDETTERFTLATICGGDSFTGRAVPFRSGRALVVMGGLLLDLREAEPGPEGAHLTVEITCGGAMIRVDDSWRIGVDEYLKAADVRVDVTPPEALPVEAPQLHIRVIGRAAGVTITSAPGDLYA